MSKPFVVDETEAVLVLDETTPFPGAEIEVSLSVAWPTFMALRQWSTDMADLGDDPDMDRVDEALTGAADLFEPYLKRWNLVTKAGKPIPATAKGLLSIRNSGLMFAIIGAWSDAVKEHGEKPATD